MTAKPQENENASEHVPDATGDYVLALADGTFTRVEVEGSTKHNGVPVLRSFYSPQS